MYDVSLTNLLQYKLIIAYALGLLDLVYNLCKLTRARVLIKLKSNLVETRKMVNFARTW